MGVAEFRESQTMWPKSVRMIVSQLTLKNIRHWGVMLVIPLVATTIVARQFILNRTQDLSIWKGGGMGMFASEIKVSRFTRIYIVTPEGDRNPVIGLTPRQTYLLSALTNYPSESNFLRLAKNMRRTWWVASRGKFTYRIIDKTGKLISALPRKHLYLRAGSPRHGDYTLDWKLLVEFWKGNYDPETHLVRTRIAKTFTFPQE